MKSSSTPSSSIQISEILREQKLFFQAGKTRSLEVRVAALTRLEEVFVARKEEVLEVLKKDLGKPELEAFLSEYYFVLQEIRLLKKFLKRWMRPRRVESPFYFFPSHNEVRWEPHGQVLIIAPWNYPLQLALAPLLGALAAGNTILLKPSEYTPACASFLEACLGEAFEKGWVTVMQGDAELTSNLLEHRFDFVFFTGSTSVGRIVAEKIARHLTPSVLELGGKCPCIVDETADLSIAAKRILIGKLFNAGQTCLAPDFVAVASEVRDEFVAELKSLLEELPWEEELALIVNETHYQRLQNMLSEGAYQKGEDQPAKLHLAPRILEHTHWEDKVMEEEVFGPILPVVEYRDKEELFARLERFSEPLALYCFSRENRFVDDLTARFPSGGVCVNDVIKQSTNLKMPFGGKGESGYGRYRGKRTVEIFSYERAYMRRFFVADLFESLPPRKKQMEFFRKWMK